DLARDFVVQFGLQLQDDTCPAEVRSLGRMLRRRLDHIVAWRQAWVSNGPRNHNPGESKSRKALRPDPRQAETVTPVG
ncbi:MAG TPA: hypothetical protein VFZ79_04990, partial [Acidimicrobiales bacterium]